MRALHDRLVQPLLQLLLLRSCRLGRSSSVRGSLVSGGGGLGSKLLGCSGGTVGGNHLRGGVHGVWKGEAWAAGSSRTAAWRSCCAKQASEGR